MDKSSSIEENNKVVQYLTEKIDSLELIESFYDKVQDLLGQGVEIEFPHDLDFNYHRELIKIRKQDISFARWTFQLQIIRLLSGRPVPIKRLQWTS
jgi:hypothetical protein